MEPGILKGNDPVVLLEHKLLAWMTQQPEWLQIMALPRQQRRASMKALANRLYTIPVLDGANTVPRAVQRKAKKQLARAAITGELTKEIRQALETAAEEAASLGSEEVEPLTFDGTVPVVGELEEPDVQDEPGDAVDAEVAGEPADGGAEPEAGDVPEEGTPGASDDSA